MLPLALARTRHLVRAVSPSCARARHSRPTARAGLAGCGASNGMLAVLAAPPMAPGPRRLLAAVAAQGLCSGVAFGTSYALAALATSSAATLALTVGAGLGRLG
jgi:Zn-dependent alcohol dehydrogenase